MTHVFEIANMAAKFGKRVAPCIGCVSQLPIGALVDVCGLRVRIGDHPAIVRDDCAARRRWAGRCRRRRRRRRRGVRVVARELRRRRAAGLLCDAYAAAHAGYARGAVRAAKLGAILVKAQVVSWVDHSGLAPLLVGRGRRRRRRRRRWRQRGRRRIRWRWRWSRRRRREGRRRRRRRRRGRGIRIGASHLRGRGASGTRELTAGRGEECGAKAGSAAAARNIWESRWRGGEGRRET